MEDLKLSATSTAAAAEAGVVAAEAALAAAQTANATAAEALKPFMDAAAALVEASKALMANDEAAAAKCETMRTEIWELQEDNLKLRFRLLKANQHNRQRKVTATRQRNNTPVSLPLV
jgi:hypothetical protein